MPLLFQITQDILDIGQAAFDALIHKSNLGKTCRLFYAPTFTICNNCVPNPIGNISSTVYLHGGPISFGAGSICPLCSGLGKLQTEQYEDVVFLINWESKEFDKVWQPMIGRLPEGIVQCKGFISEMPKVSQCNYIQMDTALSQYANYRFKLAAEPVSVGNIIKHRYFTSIWQRITS